MLKSVSSATNAIGALNFKGTWNAATNTPTIVSGVGVKGDYFVVGVAGSTTIDGISNWGIGDWIVYNGNIWQRVEGGADLNGVNLTVTNTTTLSGLTASTALALDASKNVVSVVNTGTGDNVLATSPTLVTPVLGTPSSGTVTNLTGTASININGTVGATTPAAGSFTTLNTSGQVVFNDAGADVDFRVEGDTDANLLVVNAGADTVIVGAASQPALFSANAKVYVEQSGAEYIALFRNTNANPNGVAVSYSTAPNGASNFFLDCRDSAAQRFAVKSNGGIDNFSANNSNLSDRREKTNFAPAKSYLDTICAIPVQTFNYIDQSEDDPGLTLGVVAQDVQEVAPELVMESDWGTEEEPKMRLSIYQTDLQYALMKCIQEQQAIISALAARITALESN